MAVPQTPAQSRVADPVLTNLARGYRNGRLAATSLFPVVSVGARGGKVVEFGAEDFADVDTRRAPGETRQEVRFGYMGKDYALVQHALDGVLPVENLQEARAVPGIDLGMATTRKTANTVALRIEIEAATLATTPANYSAAHQAALADGSRWDGGDAQNPAAKMREIRGVIAQGIGREPNVVVAGHLVAEALREHPQVIERVKYTRGLQGLQNADMDYVTDEMLAVYFGVDRFVDATTMKGEPGAFEYVWGKNVVVAYSELGTLAEQGTPSFGYTYQLRGYPMASPAYYAHKRDSWIYPYTDESTPVIAGKDAGYLLTTVVD